MNSFYNVICPLKFCFGSVLLLSIDDIWFCVPGKGLRHTEPSVSCGLLLLGDPWWSPHQEHANVSPHKHPVRATLLAWELTKVSVAYFEMNISMIYTFTSTPSLLVSREYRLHRLHWPLGWKLNHQVHMTLSLQLEPEFPEGRVFVFCVLLSAVGLLYLSSAWNLKDDWIRAPEGTVRAQRWGRSLPQWPPQCLGSTAPRFETPGAPSGGHVAGSSGPGSLQTSVVLPVSFLQAGSSSDPQGVWTTDQSTFKSKRRDPMREVLEWGSGPHFLSYSWDVLRAPWGSMWGPCPLHPVFVGSPMRQIFIFKGSQFLFHWQTKKGYALRSCIHKTAFYKADSMEIQKTKWGGIWDSLLSVNHARVGVDTYVLFARWWWECIVEGVETDGL